jgi:NAD(P)-dependent dehydrogenase (short-subunit alcohol dehydrogenase family)
MTGVAIVTGGTGALGQAVVLRLLGDGMTVCVPFVVDHEDEALRGRVQAGADRLLTRRADVADAGAMNTFVETVRREHGRIDALVAGVGGFAGGGLLDTDRDTWDRMLAINLTSTFTAARAVVPHMASAGRGRVVAVASRAVLPPAPGFIAYTVAKAGVIAFVQALAGEMRGRGVTVNAVLPSTMDTAANRAAMPDADRSGWVPVESVASTIAFLLSDGAAHVTGALVTV